MCGSFCFTQATFGCYIYYLLVNSVGNTLRLDFGENVNKEQYVKNKMNSTAKYRIPCSSVVLQSVLWFASNHLPCNFTIEQWIYTIHQRTMTFTEKILKKTIHCTGSFVLFIQYWHIQSNNNSNNGIDADERAHYTHRQIKWKVDNSSNGQQQYAVRALYTLERYQQITT